jgi:hypothetical protein
MGRWAVMILALLLLLPQAAAAVGVGQPCGGYVGVECDNGLWCEPPAGQCGGADLKGTCVRVGTVCTMDYRPVCGCNGRTFGNDCQRRAQRVAKRADGACR